MCVCLFVYDEARGGGGGGDSIGYCTLSSAKLYKKVCDCLLIV